MPNMSNPAYIPSGANGYAAFALLMVANASARLALAGSIATGRAVRQADDLSLWALVPSGQPANVSDWVCLFSSSAIPLVRSMVDGPPVSGSQASLTLGNASYTSVAAGAAANLISITVAAPAATAAVTAVTVMGLDITVTPASRARMLLTTTGSWSAMINTTLSVQATPYNGKYVWLSGSPNLAALLAGTYLGTPTTALYYASGSWHLAHWSTSGAPAYHASSVSVATSPAGLIFTVSSGTGVPVVTMAVSDQLQVMAAINLTGLVVGTWLGGVAVASSLSSIAYLVGGLSGTPAAALGQDCICNQESFYKCVRLDPVKWAGPFPSP